MGIKRTHPLLDKINDFILRTTETGFLMNKWWKDCLADVKKYPLNIHKELHEVPLNLEHLMSAFMAYFIGIFLSMLVFCIELWY